MLKSWHRPTIMGNNSFHLNFKLPHKTPAGRQGYRIELVLDNHAKLSLVARFQVEQRPTIEYEPFQVQLRKS